MDENGCALAPSLVLQTMTTSIVDEPFTDIPMVDSDLMLMVFSVMASEILFDLSSWSGDTPSSSD
jgi:phosphate/sulfate permease